MSGFRTSAYIMVDINGQKGPNIAGRDYWVLGLYNDGVIDDGVNAECRASSDCDMKAERNNYVDNCDDASEAPDGCFGKLLNDSWQMTY